MVTVFLSIFNRMEFHLVQNQKENGRHDHISLILKGNGNIVYSVYTLRRITWNHGGLIKGSPETNRTSRQHSIEGFKWHPQYVPHHADWCELFGQMMLISSSLTVGVI